MYKMTKNEEQFYWRGVHFPGTLNKEELDIWFQLKEKVEVVKELDPKEQERWNNYFGLFAIFLIIMAFIL